ncbi:hypothetical protein [Butyrivibrio sp. VCD2006]|uniref:hypothetical protein n=1 Tax=Butyrivibrio sp. VCD2006 TaxID=1280664 RepID=UPI00041B8F04|nr:hypothetical protein [Butyrivibrio sp. VCD2006]
MSEKINEFYAFLDGRKEQVLSEVKNLAADNRMDESNILKAKANIYDICKAVFGVASKGTSEDMVKDAFFSKFSNITGQWESSLEKAKAHDDTHKILIEEAKFSAVSEIKEKVEELF